MFAGQSSGSTGFASSACPNCGSSSTVRIFRRDTTREWFLARCNACKQHFTDPQPTLDDIVGFYGDGYHEELLTAEHTRAAFGPKFESYINWIAPHLRAGGRTLDIGCSTGLFPCLLKERGFAAEGLELNSTTAKFAREQFGIPVTSQPFETAEYAPASFSLVSMTDVLEHSLSPIKTLERVHGILEDGGHALITFPDINSVESHYFHSVARITGRDWLWQNCHVPLHTWEFTRPTAEALFRRTGFRVAAFRRSHVVLEEKRGTLLSMLYLPSRMLNMPPLSRLLGTQLEFLIQKH
jgi:2-polyprenyl-3-methyl-5-hydroxy-6-metoxy-1,4-benzoquinol methylase